MLYIWKDGLWHKCSPVNGRQYYVSSYMKTTLKCPYGCKNLNKIKEIVELILFSINYQVNIDPNKYSIVTTSLEVISDKGPYYKDFLKNRQEIFK